MYDAEHKAIAVAHAGWRGTVENIMRKTVEKMYRSFNTDPKTLQVVIGPSISFESFEVGSDVFNAFNEKGLATDKQCVCSSAQLPSNNNNNMLVDNSAKDNEPKWHIDLAQCNKKTARKLRCSLSKHHLIGHLHLFKSSQILLCSSFRNGLWQNIYRHSPSWVDCLETHITPLFNLKDFK